jgi:hypothetical protein
MPSIATRGDIAIDGRPACTVHYRLKTTFSRFPPDFQMGKSGGKAGTSFGASILPAQVSAPLGGYRP